MTARTFDLMLQLLRDSNLTVLMDEIAIVEDRFAVAGRLDPSPIGGIVYESSV